MDWSSNNKFDDLVKAIKTDTHDMSINENIDPNEKSLLVKWIQLLKKYEEDALDFYFNLNNINILQTISRDFTLYIIKNPLTTNYSPLNPYRNSNWDVLNIFKNQKIKDIVMGAIFKLSRFQSKHVLYFQLNDLFNSFKIEHQIQQLTNEIKDLKEKFNTEILYRPGGQGYLDAKDNFENLQNKFNRL